MTKKSEILKFSKIVLNTAYEMNNTMRMLQKLNVLYFFNEVYPCMSRENTEVLSWNNHIPSRSNCGRNFTKLDQYSHIISTNSFHCILFDGSIIRSSFEFTGAKLIFHSHLWWPAPYDYELDTTDGCTPQVLFDEFTSDPKWMNVVSMRSPMRIDFSPESENEKHPLLHMHVQHPECRLSIDRPICFNAFMIFILQNFYPKFDLNYAEWNLLEYAINRQKYANYDQSKTRILI